MERTKLPGIPETLAWADPSSGEVSFLADSTVYPLDAVYATAYVFLDRCWVLLGRHDGHWRVVLAPKKGPADDETLRAMLGEFANELLSSAWRHEITRQNRATIEAVVMHALGGAMGPPGLDELEEFDFSSEPFEDPLGIAQSWEEKYRKRTAEAANEPPSGSSAPRDAEGAAAATPANGREPSAAEADAVAGPAQGGDGDPESAR
ncbi:MAG: His-Xaa-Ser system protein HxsD [Myxococcota bacterium]|nr:His-Xaa-Ser system protein HxsD [Myxococcota bacterium]MDW8362290.1 His-Xaa-Ser system protein HxsD [Myxococcales bacterium]